MFAQILTALVALAPTAPPVRPVALVLSVKGAAKLERDRDKPVPVFRTDLLRPGDQVSIPADGEVLVLFSTGQRFRLKGGNRVTLEAGDVKPESAVEQLQRQPPSKELLAALAGELQSGQLSAATLGGQSHLAIWPMQGSHIIEDRPEFSWPAVRGARIYRLTLYEGESLKPLWSVETKETSLKYPEKKGPLRRGIVPVRHHVRVEAILDEEREIVLGRVSFSVLPAELVKALGPIHELARSKDLADVTLAAVLYQAHDLHQEALGLFERLAREGGEDGRVQLLLARYYQHLGLKERADAALARARKLGVNP